MTSINFKDEFGSYTIEINKDGMTIDEVFEDLITPVLLAAGYSRKNIEDRICDGCG